MEKNSTKLIKLLQDHGWEVVRTRGSHVQLKHRDVKFLLTVPHPKKDLGIGLVKQIYKKSGLK